MVDGSKRGDVVNKKIEKGRLEIIGGIGNERTLSADNLSGSLSVVSNQSPVDETSITDIGIIGVLSDSRDDLLDKIHGVGVVQEELDGSGEERELDASRLLLEAIDEGLQELIRVINTVSVPIDERSASSHTHQ